MMGSIEISKGNQYDRDGFSLTDGVCHGYGTADASKPGGYCLDGNLHPWLFANESAINAAILATLADGQTRTITIKTAHSADVIVSTEDDFESTGFGVCPRCHTYCCGDCRQ